MQRGITWNIVHTKAYRMNDFIWFCIRFEWFNRGDIYWCRQITQMRNWWRDYHKFESSVPACGTSALSLRVFFLILSFGNFGLWNISQRWEMRVRTFIIVQPPHENNGQVFYVHPQIHQHETSPRPLTCFYVSVFSSGTTRKTESINNVSSSPSSVDENFKNLTNFCRLVLWKQSRVVKNDR